MRMYIYLQVEKLPGKRNALIGRINSSKIKMISMLKLTFVFVKLVDMWEKYKDPEMQIGFENNM